MKRLAILFFLMYSSAYAQESWPPKYMDMRFMENWNRDTEKDSIAMARDWSDKVKNLYLSSNKTVWAAFGGQVRLRYMGTINEEFKESNSGLFTMRARLHSEFNFGRYFRVFAEGIYSNTTNDDDERIGGGSPVDKGALLNLFAEGSFELSENAKLMTWFGRREIQWGHERMLSPGNWLMTRRSWDGGGVSLDWKDYSFDWFLANPVIVVPDGYSTRDSETLLWGVRMKTVQSEYSPVAGLGGTSWSRHQKLLFEPYFINAQRKDVVFQQSTDSDHRNTFGLLLAGPISNSPVDFEFEGMYQIGNHGSSEIRAYSLTAELGITFDKLHSRPHLWIAGDYSSGDKDSDDEELGTFDPLYPQVSTWFGEHGLIDRKNLLALSANLDFEPIPSMMLRLTYWNLNRSEEADAVYNTSGGILRPANGSSSKDLGDSFQFSTTYEPSYHWQLTFTYNYWNPGTFFSDTQDTRALVQHFLMITTQYTF